MLERVALHQSRFRTPGVRPDSRGVLLGQKGVVLFPSLDRLVAFLRSYGEEGSLDELLPSMELHQLRTPLRTRELLLSVNAESSYRMDRIAGFAKLAGAMTFTGTSRHFVQYRDASSPLGYDVGRLRTEDAELFLYHSSFEQKYAYERPLSFEDLVFQLTPRRQPVADTDKASHRWVIAETGVGPAVLRYLFRWRVQARAAVVEWPPQSAFDDKPRRLYLFDVPSLPPRIRKLFNRTPGVSLFVPLGDNLGVEDGFRHPISLESCRSIFDEDRLFLFCGDGTEHVVHPVPPFAPVGTLVRNDLRTEDVHFPTEADSQSGPLGALPFPLRLAPTMEPWRAVTASFVPKAHHEWLGKVLYALPRGTLEALRIAVGSDGFYLYCETGIEGVPLGRFYTEIAPRIFVPAGMTLVPAVAPEVLDGLLKGRGQGFAYFDPEGGPPKVVPPASFGPVAREMVEDIVAVPVDASPLGADSTELPLLRYDVPRRLPLWGLPEVPQGAVLPSGDE